MQKKFHCREFLLEPESSEDLTGTGAIKMVGKVGYNRLFRIKYLTIDIDYKHLREYLLTRG